MLFLLVFIKSLRRKEAELFILYESVRYDYFAINRHIDKREISTIQKYKLEN